MNSVNLIGRLTRDPEIRTSQSGTVVARFSIAIDRQKGKNGDAGVDFPSIVCFGKTAELVDKYMGKGRLVGITGRLQTGSYEKEGHKYYTTDVVADRVEFLDKANSASGSEGRGEERYPSESSYAPAIPAGFTQLTDDDIPF